MQLKHIFAPGRLVQAVDILRDDRLQLALALQLRQAQVGAVGPGPVNDELVTVEFVVLLRMRHEEGVAQDRLGRIIIFLVIQAIHTAEIRDAALGRDAGTAEKHDPVAAVDPLF